MKERIETMINTFKNGHYDREMVHINYDSMLEDFILNYDESLLPLMKELIEMQKSFWYA